MRPNSLPTAQRALVSWIFSLLTLETLDSVAGNNDRALCISRCKRNRTSNTCTFTLMLTYWHSYCHQIFYTQVKSTHVLHARYKTWARLPAYCVSIFIWSDASVACFPEVWHVSIERCFQAFEQSRTEKKVRVATRMMITRSSSARQRY